MFLSTFFRLHRQARRRRSFSRALSLFAEESGVALRFPPHSKKRHLFPRPRNAFPRTPALASRFSCLFYHGENVPCRIPKPGNGGTISTHNAFLVCLEIGQIIDLEADPSPRQFIDRTIDIFHREV